MDQPNPTYHHRFRLTEERSDDGRSIVDHQYNPPSSLLTDRMEGV